MELKLLILLMLFCALSAPILFGVRRQAKGRERRQKPAKMAGFTDQPVTVDEDAGNLGHNAHPSENAWFEIAGGSAIPLPINGPIVRIGRHEENEIRLSDTTVHNHHAVLGRCPGGEFRITDLSGDNGNGVFLNGSRVMEATLGDGDIVELGKELLRFRQG